MCVFYILELSSVCFQWGVFSTLWHRVLESEGGRRGRTHRQNVRCTGVLTPRKRPLMPAKHDWQEGWPPRKPYAHTYIHTNNNPPSDTPSTPSSSHKAALGFILAALAYTFMLLQKPNDRFSKGKSSWRQTEFWLPLKWRLLGCCLVMDAVLKGTKDLGKWWRPLKNEGCFDGSLQVDCYCVLWMYFRISNGHWGYVEVYWHLESFLPTTSTVASEDSCLPKVTALLSCIQASRV